MIFRPLSGAHFNPAVSIAFALRAALPWREAALYIGAQLAGGIIGVLAAHLMFDLAPLMIGTTARSGPSQWFAEAVATFALVLTILGGIRHAPHAVPWLVGLAMRAVRRGGWRDPALFALVILTIGSVNASSLSFVCVGPALWLLVDACRGRQAVMSCGSSYPRY